MQPINIPPLIAQVLDTGYANLHELDTVYSVEDCYDLLEAYSVNAYNKNLMEEKANR